MTELEKKKKKAKAIRLYTEDHLTQAQVAYRCDVGVRTVAAWLREAGVKPNIAPRFNVAAVGGAW